MKKTKTIERDDEGQFAEKGTGTTDKVPRNALRSAVETLREKRGEKQLSQELEDFLISRFNFERDFRTTETALAYFYSVSKEYWKYLLASGGQIPAYGAGEDLAEKIVAQNENSEQ